MLDTDTSLLKSDSTQLKVISVGEDEDSLDELDRLLDTLGVKPVGRVTAVLKKIHPATYVGQGKVQEIQDALSACDAGAAIFDCELSPNQLRNLEKALGKSVLDRPGVIIEIFTEHARTKEAKTQVALARLQYILPRLSHFWSHFERQRGGGTSNRGMGEKQIEVDRRLVKKRMSVLRERLSEIEKERKVQRSGRKDVLKVALVGYTNAGKSTLLNALTQSHVLAENKLFATLDASVRSLDPFSKPPIVAIDTVGFISRLPPTLVASFRSTLEELKEADLLVHVVDVSSPRAKEELQVTEEILEELEVGDTPRLTVLNKMDAIGTAAAARNRARLICPGALTLSALQASDVDRLRNLILDHFKKNLQLLEIVIPYSESKVEAQLHAYGNILISRHLEKGTFFKVQIEEQWSNKLGLKRFLT